MKSIPVEFVVPQPDIDGEWFGALLNGKKYVMQCEDEGYTFRMHEYVQYGMCGWFQTKRELIYKAHRCGPTQVFSFDTKCERDAWLNS